MEESADDSTEGAISIWEPTPTFISDIPCWLEDADVRRGVRAMLKRDRCLEDLRQLKTEAANLSRFLETELVAIESSLNDPNSSSPALRALLKLTFHF